MYPELKYTEKQRTEIVNGVERQVTYYETDDKLLEKQKAWDCWWAHVSDYIPLNEQAEWIKSYPPPIPDMKAYKENKKKISDRLADKYPTENQEAFDERLEKLSQWFQEKLKQDKKSNLRRNEDPNDIS